MHHSWRIYSSIQYKSVPFIIEENNKTIAMKDSVFRLGKFFILLKLFFLLFATAFFGHVDWLYVPLSINIAQEKYTMNLKRSYIISSLHCNHFFNTSCGLKNLWSFAECILWLKVIFIFDFFLAKREYYFDYLCIFFLVTSRNICSFLWNNFSFWI